MILPALAALIVSIADSARAETCLRFETALALAAARSPDVEAAAASSAEAAAELRDARSLARPQLSAFGRTGVGDLGAANSVVQNQIGLRLSQRVFDFGDARLARSSARAAAQSAEASVEERRLAAAAALGETYFEHLEATARLAEIEGRKIYFAELLASLERLLPRGGATLAERAEAGARLAEAEAAAEELRFVVRRAETVIALETGLRLPPCEARPAAAFLALHGAVIANGEDAAAMAEARNPSLKSFEARARSAEEARRREARARLPIVEVVAISAYSSAGDSGDFAFQDRVGVDVSTPIYSGAGLAARNDRAAARLRLAKAETERARRELQELASVGFLRIGALEAQIVSLRLAEQRSREEFAAAEIEHARNLRTLPELIETRLAVEAAAIARIRAEFDLLRERLALLQLTAALPLDLSQPAPTAGEAE